MILPLLEKYTALEGLVGTPNGAKMLCPYHEDRSPSFHVHEEKGMAKCFSCKVFRPLFVFLVEQGVPLTEAIHYQFSFVPNVDRGELRPLQEYTLGYAIPKSMLDRGFTLDTLDHFGVGYDEVARHTTIPMRFEGNLYAVKQRTYPKGFSFTAGFMKDQFLYNYAPTEERIYVEGETDTWRVHQNGSPNVSAFLGSDVSPFQAELMGQHKRVLLATDNDEAGYRCVYKAYALLRDYPDTELALIRFRAQDAGECDEQEWRRAVADPRPILEFFIEFRKRFPALHAQWATWEQGYQMTNHGKNQKRRA